MRNWRSHLRKSDLRYLLWSNRWRRHPSQQNHRCRNLSGTSPTHSGHRHSIVHRLAQKEALQSWQRQPSNPNLPQPMMSRDPSLKTSQQLHSQRWWPRHRWNSAHNSRCRLPTRNRLWTNGWILTTTLEHPSRTFRRHRMPSLSQRSKNRKHPLHRPLSQRCLSNVHQLRHSPPNRPKLRQSLSSLMHLGHP